MGAGLTSLKSKLDLMSAWPTATPSEVRFDPALFTTAFNNLPSPAVVIRHGKLVATKGTYTTAAPIWSDSKSLCAMIFGRQLQLGNIANYDVTVPGSDVPTGPTATFRQFLNMTSDYNLDSPSHAPGTHHAYNNGAIHFYTNYIRDTFYTGNTEAQFLSNALGTALGFEDSIGFAGFFSGWDGGWSVSARDLGRAGQLILNRGLWEGTQLIPASFCDDLFQCQIPHTTTASTDTADEFYNQTGATPALPGAYSLGHWLVLQQVQMAGAFGSTVFVSRDYDMVLCAVNTSVDHDGGKITNPMYLAIRDSIVPTATRKIAA